MRKIMGFGARTRLLLALFLVCTLVPGLGGAAAEGAALPAVNGSGSTFAQVAIQQWTSDVARIYGLRVNYGPNGSNAGRAQFAQRLVDFASSDVSYKFPQGQGVEAALPNFPYTYMPLVAGGTAVLFNLKDDAGRPITDLQLSGETLIKVLTHGFFEQYKGEAAVYWDDPAIRADNPQLVGRLPHRQMRVVARSEGSGTTSVFTSYLDAVDHGRWSAFMAGSTSCGGGGCGDGQPAQDCTSVVCGPTSHWPQRPQTDLLSGSDGVANYILSYPNSIGYDEYAFALQRGISVARIRNQAGNYVLPVPCNQAIALTRAERNADGTYNLNRVYTHDHPSAYPISSYNYVIVPSGGGADPQKGAALGQFILYSITDGQKKAAALGYSPLPTNLIQQGFNALNQVPGHPAIPADPATWGQYYQSLKLPDGTKCGTAGQTGTGTGISGGAGTPTGGAGTPGGTPGTTNTPGAPGATNTPGGPGTPGAGNTPGGLAFGPAGNGVNSKVDPVQAAAAARDVAATTKALGVPWLLYLAIGLTVVVFFLPVPLSFYMRGRRRDPAP